MPKISVRGQAMPASPIRKLVPFAEQAVLAGKKVIYLNIGQPDIVTPAPIMDAIKNFDKSVLAYSHSAGFLSYRQKLTTYYQKYGVQLTPSDIIVTTGGSEAIMFAMFSCLDAGDQVIIPEPFYANYNGFAQAGNVEVVPITASINNNFALPDVADFEKKITEKTRAILICNPSNPTGYLYTKDELERLRQICIKHDLFLFADEVYREFAYDGATHTSVLSLEGLKEHAVVVDSVSKRYSACGARIGCLVSRNKTLLQTALKFAQARLSPPTFGQVGAEAAIDLPDSYFEGVLEEYQHRRNVLVDGLNSIEGVICPRPKGAFYVICQLPIDDSETFCKWLLSDFEHEGTTVMLAPGSGFYATKGLGKKEVRIAYVLQEAALKQAIVCLSAALKAYPNSTYDK